MRGRLKMLGPLTNAATLRPLWRYGDRERRRALPLPSSMSASCITAARACRRTMAKPRSGIASPLSRGDAIAQGNLGFMYYSGQGVPQDYGEAAKWYRLAAEQGNATAQSNLGSMYYSGQGVPQDYVQAYMWVNLAASRFPPSAKEDRDEAARNRNIVASKMTREQLAEAKKLVREWKPKGPAR